MDNTQLSLVRELFDLASELPPPERKQYLDAHCIDVAVRARVESLLASHDHAEQFLSTPAADLTTLRTLADEPPSQPPARDPLLGSTLGQYRITGVLGVGGMGVVYRAEQSATQRAVAIKVIRSAFADAALLRRFRQESLVLGRLKHPGIAQIYEAGTAPGPDGREVPFFAMELVTGRGVLEYATSAALGSRERLDLFARICDAVSHAHQKGVIHRDLKPANILIEEDAATTGTWTGSTVITGVQPKILDFGVARLTDLDLAVTTMRTDVGQVIGTLAYMSPEQVRGETDRLDTRSDIYALGVIMCELLTGRLPYEVKGKPIGQVARIISEDDPTLHLEGTRALKGDVETILQKTLAKEPDRRYQSAAELAADVRRHLTNMPIIARPATASYQLRKFATRNKALVGGVIATILVLAMGIVGTSIGLVKSRQAQRLAEQREAQADLEARKARRAIDFLVGMLTSADPNRRPGHEVTVREVLDAAGQGVDQELKDEPEISRTVHDAIERTYRAIGDPVRSLEHIESVKRLTAGIEGEQSVEYAIALHEQSVALNDAKEWKAAEEAGIKSLQLLEARLPATDARIGPVCATLSGSLLSQGRIPEAEPYVRRALSIAEAAGVTLEIASSLTLLAEVIERKGGAGAAVEVESSYQRVLNLYKAQYGELHGQTLAALDKYAYFLANQQRDSEAVPLFHQIIDGYTRIFGAEDRRTLDAYSNLATALVDVGDFEGADAAAAKSIEGMRKVAPGSPDLASALSSRGVIASRRKEFALAETCHREALAIRIAKGSVNATTSMANLASALKSQNRFAEAAELSLQAIERRRAAGALMTDFGVMLNNHGDLLGNLGKDVEAEKYFRDSLAFDKEKRPGNPANALNLRNFVVFLHKRGRDAEAEPLAREAFELTAKLAKPQRARVVDCLILVLEGQKKTEEAATLRASFDLPPVQPAK